MGLVGPTIGRQTNQPKMNWICQHWYIYGFLFVVTWICQLSWDPWADHWKTNQPSKDELMMLAMMWPVPITIGIICFECEVKWTYGMNRAEEIWQWHAIAHRPISVTTASAAFLQFDWKLLRQFPIMRGMRLLASVVTPRSYSISSGTGCISSILLKVAIFQLWEALFGPPSHMPVRAKSINIHIWCRIVRLLIL